MTVTDSYIHTVTPTASANEEWLLPFPVRHDNELYVWVYNKAAETYERVFRGKPGAYTIRRDGDSVYVVWDGISPLGSGYDIRFQRHMQGLQTGEYRSNYSNITPTGFQVGIDEVTEIALQNMRVDLGDREHWSPQGDRIANVEDAIVDSQVVTKSQVDTLVGGGSNPFTISSGDVGQYAAAATGSDGYTWEPFNGTPDPKNQEYKYLSGTGWIEIDILETVFGTKAEDRLLTDVDGDAWWNVVTEPPMGAGIPNNTNFATGRAMYIHRYDDRGGAIDTAGWQDFHCSPDLLPNETSNRLTTIEDDTEYTDARGIKTDYTKVLKTTTHTVECRRKPEGEPDYKNYSGIGDINDNGSCDHPVYIGSFANPLGTSSAVPFFTPHECITDVDWMHNNVPHTHTLRWTWVINIISITNTTITFAASSSLHERYSLVEGDYGNYRGITIPDPIDISFNVMWFLEKIE